MSTIYPYLKKEKAGLCLYLKITPSSPINQITGTHNGHLKIKIKGAREKGKANKELISYLCCIFDLSKKDILILSGKKDVYKKILLMHITLLQAQAVLQNHSA